MDFVNWVEAELSKREWTRSDLARKSKISQPQITRVLSRQQNPGVKFCEGIAKAFGISKEEVYRAAGLLPKADIKDELLRRVEFKLSRFTDLKDIERIERIIDSLAPDEPQDRRKRA